MKLAITDANRWPVAITAVLIAQVAFGVWMSHVASDDPHFAVEPNYYARAVNWDATMAQSRADKALGWKSAATLKRTTGTAATLHVTLVDSAGAAVIADSVSVAAVAIAHSNTVNALRLAPDGTGYSVAVPVAGTGLWEVQLRAVRGKDVFTHILRTELK
jgi:nitrogen fixation protein FixH